ncbi:MAG TPA: hypothetical protein VFD56_15150 [Chitinophagaceae bacterium]|nr:hypothetical protein [Chitinophagaceae bacterium]
MPINKNHEFDELDGVKCAIVERNVSPERVSFLKSLLEFNGYTVVVVPTPPPKAVAPPPKPAAVIAEGETTQPVQTEPPPLPSPPPAPETFTVGVTNVAFNVTNAIFGRLLRTPDGHVVTMAYWQQKENISNDEIPYFQSKH